MKSILAMLGLMAFLWNHAWPQSTKDVPSAPTKGQPVYKVSLFKPSQQDASELSRHIQAFGLLKLDEEALARALHQLPEHLELRLPAAGRQPEMELELGRVEALSPGFSAVLASTGRPVPAGTGLHYRGVIKGREGSVAALSLFEGEVMGLFSSEADGNLALGPLGSKEEYILYEDSQVLAQLPFDCATPDDGPPYTRDQLEAPVAGRYLSDCVDIYLEADHDIYQSKGGAPGAINYLAGLFNQVAALYAAEGISIQLSELFLWDVPSPYSGANSYDLLTQFASYRPVFNGDLGQLVSYQSSGGIAYLSGLCNPYSPKHSFSSINAAYVAVPAYSFSVMVVAHELGHLFGSQHTHACAWNGNGTALDGCPGFTEGNCPLPPNPAGGGTIMSYCHLNSTGINFSRGFGPQPGNVIRNAVINASCLRACDDNGGSGPPPGGNCEANKITLSLALDAYGGETAWELRDSNNTVLFSGGPYPNMGGGATLEQAFCLENGCYTFRITDAFGDGICCAFGNGSYTLADSSGAVIASGGNFGYSESIGFCLPLEDGPGPAGCLFAYFNDYEIISYGGAQDAGYARLYENGKVLKIGGNAWKAIELEYTVTPETVMELEFGATLPGEVHGIGFDDNNSISSNRTFRLFGYQDWGIGDFDDYPGNASWKHYRIPVGRFFTGSFNRLFFVADHDSYPRNGNSYFRNIRIYEGDGCESALQPAGETAGALPEAGTALKIFPNPARDWLTINLFSPQAGQAYIQAFSFTGQLVLEQELGVLPGASRHQLPVSGLPSGTYLLKISAGREQLVEKFTVVRN